MWKLFSALIFLSATRWMPCDAQVSTPNNTPVDYRANAKAGLQVLQQSFNSSTGRWNTAGWWNSANCLQAVADLRKLDHDLDDITAPVFEATFTNARAAQLVNKRHVLTRRQRTDGAAAKFLNGYYDDEVWWALAFITVYDITKDTKYLDIAKGVFQDIDQTAAPATCGGIYWDRQRTSQTAIANDLALYLAAALARRTTGDESDFYRKWAEAQWKFVQGSGLLRSDNIVIDHFNMPNCTLDQSVYTYNQGVLIGALVELKLLTKDGTLLEKANDIAKASIASLTTPEGILIEKLGAENSTDGAQFKGIFARNLMRLQNKDHTANYTEFFANNAINIWNLRSANGTFGYWWNQQSTVFNAATHSSALMAITGAYSVRAPTKNLTGTSTAGPGTSSAT